MDDQIPAPGSPIYNEDDISSSRNENNSTSEVVLYTPEISFQKELPQSLESQNKPEIISPPETITRLGEDNPKEQHEEPLSNVQSQELTSGPKVIDKSHEPLKIHVIKKPGDKLTEEADKEEKHFIEEVEKHHGG